MQEILLSPTAVQSIQVSLTVVMLFVGLLILVIGLLAYQMTGGGSLKAWYLLQGQGLRAYLQANPKIKNWLDGLEKVVIASVLSYSALIFNEYTHGLPLTGNMSHGLLAGLLGGLFIAVSGPVKAYCQNLHDEVLANNQDVGQALTSNQIAARDVPPPKSSALTPLLPKN